ncbi:MAG: CDP-diacylglycerol--glycerol-3-phosphate 3-phosphatidyltransferase [Melioribacteraceae bacterium]|nr:CDP-diacylglycerol--glycerol-3-phosphate 3-phosphatidyltransferase [Melioribacteraceae bacterium]
MVLPNQLTILRIILTPVFLWLFLQEDPLMKQISLLVFVIAAITDWYDGWLARKFNYITTWGKFLDPLADKILTSSAFLAFVIIGMLELWMVIIIILRDFTITGLRAYAEYKNHYFLTSRLAKWKTFIQMIYIYYLLLVYVAGTFVTIRDDYKNIYNVLLDENLIYYSMLLITLFTLITGLLYLNKNRNLIKKIFEFEN